MAASLKRQAHKLAGKGRGEDEHLLHITHKELMNLLGTGRVTRNPKTGLPEAWGWSSIRDFGEATLGGAAAGGIAGTLYGGYEQQTNPTGPQAQNLETLGGAVAGVGASFLAPEAFGGGVTEEEDVRLGLTAEGEGGGTAYFGGGGAGTGPGGFPSMDSGWTPTGGEGMGMPGETTTTGETVPGGPESVRSLWGVGDYLPSGRQALGGLQIAAGGYGLYNAYQGRQAQRQQQRQQQEYFDRLNALMSNPGQVSSLPGYQFGLSQGNEALARRMASMGYGTSGNLAMATQQFGTDYAQGALGIQEQLLASQYGRATPPTQQMPDPTKLAFQSLSNLGYGASAFGTPGGY